MPNRNHLSLGPAPLLHRLHHFASTRCSPTSSLIFAGPTSPARTSSDYGHPAFPMRAARYSGRSSRRSPSFRKKSFRACQGLRPRGAVGTRLTCPPLLPSVSPKTSALRGSWLSRLNGWPALSPVNASPQTSRSKAHDSGADVIRYYLHRRGLSPPTLSPASTGAFRTFQPASCSDRRLSSPLFFNSASSIASAGGMMRAGKPAVRRRAGWNARGSKKSGPGGQSAGFSARRIVICDSLVLTGRD